MQIVLNDSSHNNSFTLFNYLLTFIRSVTFAKLPILFTSLGTEPLLFMPFYTSDFYDFYSLDES